MQLPMLSDFSKLFQIFIGNLGGNIYLCHPFPGNISIRRREGEEETYRVPQRTHLDVERGNPFVSDLPPLILFTVGPRSVRMKPSGAILSNTRGGLGMSAS